MIVDTIYYIFSLIMVLIMLSIRDFVIPSIVWLHYFKDKSYTYRFFFSIISQATIQINLVLLLGLFGICNRFTLLGSNLVIYALIMWNYSDRNFYRKFKITFKNISKAYNDKRFIEFIISKIKILLKQLYSRIFKTKGWYYLKENIIEITLLLIISIYNIWFLTHNVLIYHSYQFSDIPVHQSWIYNLEQGKLFSDGIYPFGMHGMIYYIRMLFNYDLREILLYAGAYQTVILLLVIYFLAKEIFKGKYSPIAALIITSLMLNQGRYGASLPQEVGMYAVVSMAFFLIRYLHEDRGKLKIQGDSYIRGLFRIKVYINRKYFNNDLILFMLSVALIVNYHYYTAIAAIFLVIAILIAYLPKIIKKQYLIPILYAGLFGGLIAILPTGIALIKGIPFQESMAWATTVMSGEEWHGSEADYEDSLNEALGNKTKEETGEEIGEESDEKIKVDYSSMTMREILQYYYNSIYEFGRMSMFGDKATTIMFTSMFISLIIGIILLPFPKGRIISYDYFSIIIYILIISTFGAATSFGIPEIIAAARASTFAEPFIGIIYLMPIDIIFRLFGLWKNKYYTKLLNLVSFATCIGLGVLVVNFGFYHDFFDVNLSYYNESEYVLRHIKKSYDKFDFTVVATTDEYYEVINHGRHTEISKFINMIDENEEEFVFPTKYVFFFIEKTVINDYNYGQVEVNQQYANMDFIFLQDAQDYYFQRAIIESKAYYWAKEFERLYPRNFKIFFEDDIYIVYRLEQNTYSPFRLQIDY